MNTTLSTSSRPARQYWLDVARAIAIISISCNHAINRAYDNYVDTAAEFAAISTVSTVFKAFVTIFSRLGVPIFLMISGALLLHKRMDGPEDLKRFYRHNLLQLFITAEIWYFLFFWFLVLCTPGGHALRSASPIEILRSLVQTMLFQNQVTMNSMWYMSLILVLYPTIPFLIIVVSHMPLRYMILPPLLLFLNNMLLPAINSQVTIDGGTTYTSAIWPAYVGCLYYLYLLAGYWLSENGLQKVRGRFLGLGMIASYLACVGYQFYTYSRPGNVQVSYSSPGILLCAVFTFAFIRRFAPYLQKLRRPVTYLSKISLGIYFVHVLLLQLLCWYGKLPVCPRPIQFLLYEILPVGGSVLVIWLLSHIPILRKRLFLIKN